MRKISYIAFAIILFVLIGSTHGLCRGRSNLYNLFRKKAETRVYIPRIEDLSGDNKADITCLTQKLKDALKKRKSIRFDIVEREEDSDITIGCSLLAFYWSEKDPVDLIMGTYAIAYDLLTTQNYAFQEVIFTVTDTKKNKVLWKERLKIDLTRKNMTEDQSTALINKKTVKTFMRDCFSKRYSKGR